MDFENQWIEIFRVGDYGDKGRYTQAELDAMVANLKHWKPPLVLGHPKDDSPALGWAAELKRDGDRLLMRAEQIQPQLVEHARSGRFPNRSVAIYTNPKGTGPAVRHVGFLGATPPEVKGLAPIRFSDGEYVAIEFNDSPGTPGEKEEQVDLKEISHTVDERIRAFFSELFGKKAEGGPTAEQLGEQVKAAVSAAVEPLKTQITTLAEENKKLREGLTTSVTNAQLGKFDERVAALRTAGKIVPAMDGAIQLMRERVEQGGAVKFTEGAGAQARPAELPVLDYALRQLEALPQIVPLGEAVKGRRTPKGKMIAFTPGRGGEQLDPNSVVVMERAKEIAAERKIPFGEALTEARTEFAEGQPAHAGGIAAGQA